MKLIDKVIERKSNLVLLFPGLYAITKRLALIDLLAAVELARNFNIPRGLTNQPNQLSQEKKAVLDAVMQLDEFITQKLKARNNKSHSQLKKLISNYGKYFSINISTNNIADAPFKTLLCSCHDELFNKITQTDLDNFAIVQTYLSETLELTSEKEKTQMKQLVDGLKNRLTLHLQQIQPLKSPYLSSTDKLSNVSLGSPNPEPVHDESAAGYDTICDREDLLIGAEYDMIEDIQPAKRI